MQKVFFIEEFSLDLSDSTMCILPVNRQIFPILLCSSYREFVVASLTVSSCSLFHLWVFISRCTFTSKQTLDSFKYEGTNRI